ncbi:MAG TPA: DUF302 domain-containing protein [Opitutus sp.]|nr:DUF302 domain-containing protein [Opitutus sp.]
MQSDFLLTTASELPLETVCQRLPEISAQHQFGVLGVHNLREKMASKGVPFDRECRVFEVCNPRHAQRVLAENISISSALPCRIAVYPEDGRTVLATLKPTALLTLFAAPGAAAVAREVEDTLVRIMAEAAG